MALTQQLVFSQAEVLPNGIVQVRMDNQIQDDSTTPATIISQGNFQRHVVCPGDDYTKECKQVQAICKAVHTPDVIAAYQASLPTTLTVTS